MRTFRARIMLLLLGLVIATQLATVAALVVQMNGDAQSHARDQLRSAGRILGTLLESRAQQLRDGVRVLAADYGFKEAATFGDRSTVFSALENVAGRIGADMATLVDREGRIIASTHPVLSQASGSPSPFRLQDVAANGDEVTDGYQLLVDHRYMLVMAPVKAPTTIGYVVMGFAVDARLAENMSRLLGLNVGFYDRESEPDQALLPGIPSAAASATEAFLQAQLTELADPVLVGVEGAPLMTWAEPVANSDGLLLAVLQQPLEDALATYTRSRTTILLISALGFALAIPVARWLARQASRPIEDLVAAARRIEAGNYGETVQLEGAPEFARVATTLNSMQAHIAERERQVHHLAMHDSLSGLPNRLSAIEWITERAGMATRGEGGLLRFPFLLLNISDFARIQASLGHTIADKVLHDIGRQLRTRLGPGDLLAHVGTARFLLGVPGLPCERAEFFAAQLIESLRSGVVVDDVAITLDAHVGICHYPDHGTRAADILRRLDSALYDAHDTGLPTVVYRPGRDADHQRQLALLGDLRAAMASGQLSLHYQPKVTLRDHEVRGLEALVRWAHPTLGNVPPAEFVPLLERTGAVTQLTDWVISAVIAQMADWRARGFEPDVSVNLSAADLLEPRLPERVADALRRSGVPAHKLVFEITESAVMRDAEGAIRAMERMRQAGHRFSIDDFGTGYSSLAQLKRLPVDEIKIDKSFVLRLRAGSDDALIVQSTIELGHNFGVTVVAEGVETADSWRLLREFNCDSAQGYLISRPLAADAVFETITLLNGRLEWADTPTSQIRALQERLEIGEEPVRSA